MSVTGIPLVSIVTAAGMSDQAVIIDLVKENRYRMEYINTYIGINNVAMHVIEHDIILTQDTIFDFKRSGLKSPVIKF